MTKTEQLVEKAEQALDEYNDLMGTIYNELPSDKKAEVRTATDRLWTTRNELGEVDADSEYWSRDIERIW